MAPVPFQHPARYAPVAVIGAHLASVVYLTYAITTSLYTSYKLLSPAQDTRSRLAQRKRLVPAFLSLAVAALCLATYTAVSSASLSYRTWAYEHGLDLPEWFITDDEVFPETENSSKLSLTYIAQWLSDTPIYYDTLEIVVEKARRFWWSQQIDLATVAFSMLLSIEGRRRKIPLTSAFLILAHLVNLSFAQNLFCLALLLTPTPLPSGNEDLELPVVPLPTSRLIQIRDKLIPPKPKDWHLHPFILQITLVFNYGSIFFLPYAAETPSFMNMAFLARASTFLPLILPQIVPVSWGTVHSHPHDAYGSFTAIFRTISAVSFALHIKSSISGLVYNLPNSHYHRHSVFLPWDMKERSTWERSTTASSKVLGSISDHPAVQAVGWDVLVSTLSLGLWAAVRATDVQDIIESTIPFYNSRRKIEQTAKDETPRTPIKAESEPAEDAVSEHSMTLRRRGRPAKSRLGSVASSSALSEEGTGTPGRRRGRPKKTKQLGEEKAYEPPPSETKELVEGDILPANELDWESASLAWGLVAFAGLGSACAGVFEGECISR
ncbi:hypothetical protein F4677DRAFT_392366 [Hypoxylon crocopeplum]|nr:hypothetical protein F4677DRAFT_392366 [Hypoxylon crocopeplum]